MNKIKKLIMAFLMGGATYTAHAQGTHFSQYHLTPLHTSPAELGTADYFQVLSHYRKQSLAQDQGFQNLAVSSIYPLYYKNGGRRFGGIGLGVAKESSGMMGMLQETSVKAGYAYNWQVNTKNHVSFGLQGGYYRRNINLSKVTTDSQFQNGGYDPGYGVGENFTSGAGQAFKTDAGATWYKIDAYGDQLLSLGFSASNLNRANYRFLEGSQEQPLPLRYQVYGSMRALNKQRMHIIPTFRYMTERNYSQLNLGSLFQYQLQPGAASMHESHLGLGVWYSVNNAAILSLELAQPSYLLSISYDMSASSNIQKSQVNNGVEVTLGWRLNRGKGRNNAIPKVAEIADPAPVVTERQEAPKAPVQPEPKVEKLPEPEPVVVKMPEPVKEPVLTKEEAGLFEKTIHFELGKLELTNDSKVLLDNVAEVLNKNESMKVALTGYTCNMGDPAKNKQISQERAEKSKLYLINKGIASDRISSQGLGQENPVMPNSTPSGREKNRRVEIKVVK